MTDDEARRPRRRHRRVVRPGTGPTERAEPEQPAAPSRAADDGDVGWERPDETEGSGRDDDWYRRERPPHW
ncbi:hypothetical protein GCM10028777_28630 [Angustibacter speluncae]